MKSRKLSFALAAILAIASTINLAKALPPDIWEIVLYRFGEDGVPTEVPTGPNGITTLRTEEKEIKVAFGACLPAESQATGNLDRFGSRLQALSCCEVKGCWLLGVEHLRSYLSGAPVPERTTASSVFAFFPWAPAVTVEHTRPSTLCALFLLTAARAEVKVTLAVRHEDGCLSFVPFTFSIDLQKASQPSAVVGEIARTRATDCESSGCLPKAVASLQDETNRTNEMRTTLRGVAELRVDGDEEEQDETEGSFAVHRSPLVDFNKPDATDSWRESRRQDLSGSSDEEPISTEGLTPFFAQESRPGADGWVSARGTRGATRKQARLRQQSAPRFHSCSVTRAMGAKEHNTNPSSGTVSRPRVVAFPPGLHMPTASPLVRW